MTKNKCLTKFHSHYKLQFCFTNLSSIFIANLVAFPPGTRGHPKMVKMNPKNVSLKSKQQTLYLFMHVVFRLFCGSLHDKSAVFQFLKDLGELGAA